MKWDRERWRKLYCKEEGDFANLPAQTRAYAALLLKHADDSGRVQIPAGADAGEVIARLFRAHRHEYRQIGACIAVLVENGYLVREPLSLMIRNFTQAQGRSSGAERQARYRDRQRNGDDRYSDVTCDVTDPSRSRLRVTDRALSLSSSGISGSLSADPDPEDPVTARAYAEPETIPGLGSATTPEFLLDLVSRHPTLRLLHGDRQWSITVAAMLGQKLCRASDAAAAVEAFVMKHARREWTNADDLCAAIGGFFVQAKSYGDAARRREQRSGRPPVQRGGWSREDAERRQAELPTGDEV